MALPQQVIDRMSQEPPKTPGWSFGLSTFAIGIFLVAIVVYAGLTFGYEPYLNAQLANVNGQINTLAASISTGDQAKLVTFYSEITNIKSALANHVAFSHFFTWLEANTEANVYFSGISFSSENQVSFTGYAKTEADVNQQVAIFEAAPEVTTFTISGATLSGTNGLWQFNVVLAMSPSILDATPPPGSAATTTTQ